MQNDLKIKITNLFRHKYFKSTEIQLWESYIIIELRPLILVAN